MSVSALHIVNIVVRVASAYLGELAALHSINNALAVAVFLVKLVSVILEPERHPLVGGDSVSHELAASLDLINNRYLVDTQLAVVLDYTPGNGSLGGICRTEINRHVVTVRHLVGVEGKLHRVAIRFRAERRAEEGGGGRGAEVERVSLSVTGKTVYHGGGTVGRFKVAGRGFKVLYQIGISQLLLYVSKIVLCSEHVIKVGGMHAGGCAVEISLGIGGHGRLRSL